MARTWSVLVAAALGSLALPAGLALAAPMGAALGSQPMPCVTPPLRSAAGCAAGMDQALPPSPRSELRSPVSALVSDAHPWSLHALKMGLRPVAEAAALSDAGVDCYRRPLRLHPRARAAWQAMRAAARAEGIELQAVSGYRSRAAQARLVRRKLERGMPLVRALAINAAPGFSEHHGGTALDIGTPGSPAAEESFEDTRAFHWLLARAGEYGFALSYPRGNPHGINYEPWHWNWREGDGEQRAITYEGAKR